MKVYREFPSGTEGKTGMAECGAAGDTESEKRSDRTALRERGKNANEVER